MKFLIVRAEVDKGMELKIEKSIEGFIKFEEKNME
jgi:hypothetical protein